MNLPSWLVFGAIMAAFGLVIYKLISSHRKGKCVGCSSCSKQGGCPHCHGHH